MRKRVPLLVLAMLLGAAAGVWIAAPASAGNDIRTIVSSGTTTLRSAPEGSEGVQAPEIEPSASTESGEPVVNRSRPGFKNGKFPPKPLDAPSVDSAAIVGSNPGLDLSFAGLNHRQQRLANGGNQFSVEPPDQALCVGNGFVLEAVNDVLRVFDTSGAPLSGVVDLNTFFGYPAAINRTTGAFGPFVTDPVCHYDADISRWIVAVLTLDRVGTTSALAGSNHLDIAVSNTASPLGAWTLYKLPVQDDGTEGTPNHNCDAGPCLGDYPKIGADANGIYLQTNEYSLFGSDITSPGYYTGAQIYAIGKQQLASAPLSIGIVQIENATVDGSEGFTVWPAISPPGQASSENNGTEYFLSTIAGDGSESGNPTGTARRIGLWALTNTASLNAASPDVTFSSRLINSEAYVFPPRSDQKPGDFPLGQCINDTTIPTPFGTGCWNLLFVGEPAHDEVESTPDSNDSRIQQVWYTNGTLWGAADTAVNVGGEIKAGIAWFAVKPKINGAGKVEGQVKKEGYLAVANNNVTYPSLAVLPSGQGVMGFTLVGEDFFPSAAYAQIDADAATVGDVHVAAPGLGPTDGFTSYKAFVGSPPRTRWGDYGWAAVDGTSIWFASEYIDQTCTLTQWLTGAIGSCGGTRSSLGNWGTRISRLTP